MDKPSLLYVNIDVKDVCNAENNDYFHRRERVQRSHVCYLGRQKVSKFLEDLACPHVITRSLAAGYQAMSADSERESEASTWCEALVGDVYTATR